MSLSQVIARPLALSPNNLIALGNSGVLFVDTFYSNQSLRPGRSTQTRIEIRCFSVSFMPWPFQLKIAASMSHLFFIDESGHDRRQMPYEVYGGIAVPMNRAWELIGLVNSSQQQLFGQRLADAGVEWKGDTLLRHRNFKFAAQAGTELNEAERQQLAFAFLDKGRREHETKAGSETVRYARSANEFRAYGRACLEHAEEVFQACVTCDATLIASVADKNALRPPAAEWHELLRIDFVLLFERLFCLMETRPDDAMAAIVFDAIDDLASLCLP